MDSRLRSAEEEAQEYQAYLKRLESERSSDAGSKSVKELEGEYEALLAEEASLKEELRSLREEEQSGEKDLEALIQERKALEKEESSYLREYYSYTRRVLNAEDDYRSLDSQFKYAQSQWETLKRRTCITQPFIYGTSGTLRRSTASAWDVSPPFLWSGRKSMPLGDKQPFS
ncbi:Becn1 [Caligus rogercresseyi]|uniref:Becn1 n=1 Tax=Caligus rogercresseyi TaxID=217165 RepID=A0A7T8KHA5_CALRO|nr:Becn1 [Caligus rogercresseyi]